MRTYSKPLGYTATMDGGQLDGATLKVDLSDLPIRPQRVSRSPLPRFRNGHGGDVCSYFLVYDGYGGRGGGGFGAGAKRGGWHIVNPLGLVLRNAAGLLGLRTDGRQVTSVEVTEDAEQGNLHTLCVQAAHGRDLTLVHVLARERAPCLTPPTLLAHHRLFLEIWSRSHISEAWSPRHTSVAACIPHWTCRGA